MSKEHEKRRGGRFDYSEIYLNYSRRELMLMLRRIERRCINRRFIKQKVDKYRN